MPQASVVTSPTATARCAAPSPLLCTWKAAGLNAAWVLLAGELDLTTSLQLRQTLRDAQLHARVVVVDLRKLTFMDTAGACVILNSACSARREGGRVMLVRGPVQVDRVLTLTAACDEVLIVDLDPSEPAKELLDLGRRTSALHAAPGDVAEQTVAREDARRLQYLLTQTPVARLFGRTYR